MVRNFLFHRVSDEKDQLWPPMRPKVFDEVIAYLTKKFFVVNLEDYLNQPEQFKSNKKLATVLFDDGYKDNIEYAAPILKKHRCQASFYVVTNCIDENLPTWTYILDNLFQNTSSRQLHLPFEWLPEEKRANQFSSDAERISYGAWLKPFLKKVSNDKRVAMCNAVEQLFSDVETPLNKMMNWSEVKQLHDEGFTISSHSVTHPLLASINTEEELMGELTGSAARIKEKLGVFPDTISYPIGSYDERVMRCSAQAGYKYGLAVDQRFFKPKRDAIMAIPRVELYDESSIKTRMRISGAMQVIKKLVR